MIPQGSIEVRKYRADLDKPFVYSTWLRNYKHSSYFAKRIKPVVFFAGHHNAISHLLEKPGIKALVACPKDDHETILGYLVCESTEKPTVHFVFVKETFRNMGIARALFEAASLDPNKIQFTHWTYPVDDLINKFPDMIFNPYGAASGAD